MNKRIMRIDMDIQEAVLLAQYWLTLAATDYRPNKRKKRRVQQPGKVTNSEYREHYSCAPDCNECWRDMTKVEITEDCILTAKRHISRIIELHKSKIKIMFPEESEW